MYGVLLKKQFREKLLLTGKGRRRDIAGAILSLVLTAALIAVSVTVLIRLSEIYVTVRIDGVSDVDARITELMTLIYAAIFVLGVAGGVKDINYELFEREDRAILQTLPVKATTVFYSKLTFIYIKQIFLFTVTLLPVNAALMTAAEPTVLYVSTSIAACAVFPALTLMISSVICLPVFAVKRALKSKYLITLIVATAVTAALFFCYKYVLDFIRELFTTGEIRFFFNEKVMNDIMTFKKYAYPVNCLAELVMNVDPALNAAIIALTAVIAGATGFGIVAVLYNRTALLRATQTKRVRRSSMRFSPARSVVAGLIKKEFFLVYRTPSYAFQYFSVAITMPLMIYFCMNIGTDLLKQLVMIDASAELALFLVLTFGALTNTFAATNVSRDGSSFYTLKAMPVRPRAIITAKVLFSSFVALLSVLVSAAVLFATGFLDLGEAAKDFVIGSMMGFSQIAFATRKDLNRPEFNSDDDSEVRESTGTVSLIIIIGFLAGVLTGGLTLFLSVWLEGKGIAFSSLYADLTGFAVAAVLMTLSTIYLFRGLDSRLYRMSEGDE